ncbi:MAG: hypothetical protein AAFQ63_15530 [Cyanobacteria bacterium J06621_11]
MTLQTAAADTSPQYAFREVNVINSRIVITCADAAEAERAKADAIAFGIRANTSDDQLILSYGNPPTNSAKNA